MIRRRGWIGAGGVAVVLVGAWLFVGLTPSIGLGPVTHFDLESVEVESTWSDEEPGRIVVDPSDGTYDGLWTFANEGMLPVTVQLAESGKPSDLHWRASLHSYDPMSNVVHDPAETVQVVPGEQFAVSFSWGPGCSPIAAGTSMSVSYVRLAVATVGIKRIVDASAREDIGFELSSDNLPTSGCGE